jgi:hypothetical protein
MARPLVSDELWELIEPLIPKVPLLAVGVRYRWRLLEPSSSCEQLTRITMWGDSQTGHHATATSLITPRSVGVRDWWRERRSVALLEPQARGLLTGSVAAGASGRMGAPLGRI